MCVCVCVCECVCVRVRERGESKVYINLLYHNRGVFICICKFLSE